jgi:hypothetical protein
MQYHPVSQSLALGLVAIALVACSSPDDGPADDYFDPPHLTAFGPEDALPGSVFVVEGEGFVHPDYGTLIVELRGDVDGRTVEIGARATFVTRERLEVPFDGPMRDALGDHGTFEGGVRVVTTDLVGGVHASNPVRATIRLHETLDPTLTLAHEPWIHLNGRVPVVGDGILLGGDEGHTIARVWGCFYRAGETGCASVEPTEVRIVPDDPLVRTQGAFRFAPSIAGVHPGTFRGTVQIRNVHASGVERMGLETAIELEVRRPALHGVSQTSASLGQWIRFEGGGFVPTGEDSITLLELTGSFAPQSSGVERPLEIVLVPEVEDGETLRYLLSEDDQLGDHIALRRERGEIIANAVIVVRHRDQEVRSGPAPLRFVIEGVRQVVYLAFQPSWRESLRNYGLRGLAPLIEEHVMTAAREPYVGVNVDLRTEPPDDFALYSVVDIAGPDPNGLGLFGYDNSPGKDRNNQRLFDRIGGVNATTQEDGFPGYGGVFADSFLGFSSDPAGFAERIEGSGMLFDALFDPFRPDRGGRPVDGDDLAFVRDGRLPDVQGGRICPATDRAAQLSCAIWSFGNLVGGTLAHEIAHSLGLADPDGETFHNAGDQDNRLMDSGGARPFEERVQLMGQGPGVFCDDSFEYLAHILPSDEPDPVARRPGCW